MTQGEYITKPDKTYKHSNSADFLRIQNHK